MYRYILNEKVQDMAAVIYQKDKRSGLTYAYESVPTGINKRSNQEQKEDLSVALIRKQDK